MSFEFLTVERSGSADGAVPVALSPFARLQEAAGGRLEVCDGWRTAATYGPPESELEACRSRVGVVDRSALGKLELQAPEAELSAIAAEVSEGAELSCERATRASGAWWCSPSPERALVLTPPGDAAEMRDRLEAAAEGRFASVVDLSAGLAALSVIGPSARELLARLTALDLRPARMPEQGFRPGSVGRVPAMVLREQGERFLVLVGSYHAHYIWTAIADAGVQFGAAQVGADAFAELGAGERAAVEAE